MMKNIKRFFLDAVLLLPGALLFAISVNTFLLPGGIVLGGATGIATVINIFTDIPVGTLIILINIPLMVISILIFGKTFIIRTAVGILLSSLSVNYLDFFPITVTDPLLCCFFGGISMGMAMGLIYSRGYNTGGGDIAVLILRKTLKKREISIGHATLIIDGLIIAVSAIVMRSATLVFYSVITIFIETKIMDFILSGAESAKTALIITEKSDDISRLISEKLNRGITLVPCEGWYSGRKSKMLVCVIRAREIVQLNSVIKECDPSSFVILCDSSKVIGNGFNTT